MRAKEAFRLNSTHGTVIVLDSDVSLTPGVILTSGPDRWEWEVVDAFRYRNLGETLTGEYLVRAIDHEYELKVGDEIAIYE